MGYHRAELWVFVGIVGATEYKQRSIVGVRVCRGVGTDKEGEILARNERTDKEKVTAGKIKLLLCLIDECGSGR